MRRAVRSCAAWLAWASTLGGGWAVALESAPPCDTAPVLLDLRSPHVAQPLASAPQFPTGSELAAIPYTYLLHVPPGLARPAPLLVAMHGLGGSGPQFAAQSQWARFADEHGFIVAFPTGPRKWDTTPESADVRFIRSVVEQLRAERCVDPQRIWATGHSYGGFMTQRLACDASDLFAVGAAVSSGDVGMPVIGGPCDADRAAAVASGHEPMPLAFWHGTSDPVVPYNQGRVTWNEWLQRYACRVVAKDDRAVYGALEVATCTRPDVLQRQAATGSAFELRFQTYAQHRHGYADGCGGLGELSLAPCRPDRARWPTAEFQNAEILRFLQAHPRASPAPAGH